MSELDRMDADVWRRRCEELEAENERLREEMERIERVCGWGEGDGDMAVQIAREALRG